MNSFDLPLRYGVNPHQTPARVLRGEGSNALPFTVLNGAPGYINLLDALNAWQLVKELRDTSGVAAAAARSSTSARPAPPWACRSATNCTKPMPWVASRFLPLATAYARARGGDSVSSFGDMAALSDVVDVPTARLLRREVSDGVIAPGYEPEASEDAAAQEGRRLPGAADRSGLSRRRCSNGVRSSASRSSSAATTASRDRNC